MSVGLRSVVYVGGDRDVIALLGAAREIRIERLKVIAIGDTFRIDRADPVTDVVEDLAEAYGRVERLIADARSLR
jgi:hypothetical protein